ncbi:serine/threonine-protein kinase [Candidatus Uabimicrobium amorphum]|uniref:non-specific serine/threonine protein kinase n=1 Tax=Uabimicrobium amorphum TaxID=2596890 RepID=A0A5S9F4A4_UABAM|nr:serine/threonine-protein kinase [Candidatus Uabimicrobium amorphum]BBM85328.1 serine/threonine protein kinase [Candidatus Uabimicrobium amorphum]
MSQKYHIIKEIGRGGMGVVYKAQDNHLKRTVAIKTLQNMSVQAVKRFFREMRSMSKIQHPNIVRFFDMGKQGNYYYYTMEYIEGQDLASYIKTSEVNFEEIAQIITKVAHAIHVVHQHGIVHRDLKPQNILIDQNQNPYIVDFGLAKAMDCDRDVTKTAGILGTPFYMSPEQAEGKLERIDYKSDIYALGIILYELLTKKRPYQAGSLIELFCKIIENPIPPLREQNRDIPPALEYICLKAAAKKKQSRYQNAQQLAKDLEKFQQGKTFTSQRVARRWLSKITVCVVACLILGMFIFHSQKTKMIIEPSPAITAYNLMRTGLYQEAQQILKKEYAKKPTPEIQRLLFITHVDLEQYAEAQKIYSATLPQVSLYQGKMYLRKREFLRAEKFFLKATKNPAVKNEAYYSLGYLYFLQKDYQKAQMFFDKVSQTNHTFSTKDYYLLLGKTLFHSQNYSRASQCFEKVIKIYPSVNTYEYLAKCYMQTNKFSKAQTLWEKCIVFQPENSTFITKYAQSLYLQKKYKTANEQFFKALQFNPRNWEAISGVLKINYYSPTLNWQNNLHLMRLSNHTLFFHQFDLHKYYIAKVENENEKAYLAWQSLKNRQEKAHVFFKYLSSKTQVPQKSQQNAIRGLFSLRHTKTIQQTAQKYLAQEKTNSYMAEIWTMIDSRRILEAKQTLYYLLARLFLYKDVSHLEFLREQAPTIEKILHDHNEQVVHRYLAAKYFAKMMKLTKLKMPTKNKDDAITTLIKALVLKESGFSEHISQTKGMGNYDEFLRYLFIKNTSDKNWLLSEIEQDNKVTIKISALFQVVESAQHALAMEKVQEILIQCLEKKMPKAFQICAYATLWKSMAIEQSKTKNSRSKPLRHSKILFKALNHKDKKIQLTVLRYPLLYKIPGYQQKLAQLVNHPTLEISHDALLTLSSVHPGHPIFLKVLDGDNYSFSLRNLAFICLFIREMTQLDMFKILAKINLLDQKIPLWLQNPSPHFRGMVALYSSFLGVQSISRIDKEQDPQVKAFLLFALHQQSFIPQYQISQQKRYQTAMKYTTSRHKYLRMTAHLVKTCCTPQKSWQKLFREAQQGSENLKMATAYGFMVTVQKTIMNSMSLNQRFNFHKTNEYKKNSFKVFGKLIKEGKSLKQALVYADKLMFSHEVKTLLALSYMQEKQYKKALTYLQESIENNHQNPFLEKCYLAAMYQGLGMKKELRLFLQKHFSHEISSENLQFFRPSIKKIAKQAIREKCYTVATNILQQLLMQPGKDKSAIYVQLGRCYAHQDQETTLHLLAYAIADNAKITLDRLNQYPEFSVLSSKKLTALFK